MASTLRELKQRIKSKLARRDPTGSSPLSDKKEKISEIKPTSDEMNLFITVAATKNFIVGPILIGSDKKKKATIRSMDSFDSEHQANEEADTLRGYLESTSSKDLSIEVFKDPGESYKIQIVNKNAIFTDEQLNIVEQSKQSKIKNYGQSQ
jgi:hypothetical protein